VHKIKIQDLSRLHSSIADELRSTFDRHLSESAFIMGKPVAQFEEDLARFTESTHAVGVANGTDALELALEALKIGAGDAVIVPSMTFTATAEAVARMGATPVFADIDLKTYALSVETIQAAITKSSKPVKAVILVHLYGYMAPQTLEIAEFCRKNGYKLIEDCAQSQGAFLEVGGVQKHCGTIGDAGTFSFYPGKNLGALGDAGAVITQNEVIAKEIKLLRDHGRTDKYSHVRIGRNSRLDALQAGFLSVKLAHLSKWNESRRKLAAKYYQELEGCAVAVPILKPTAFLNHVFHQFVVLISENSKYSRSDIMKNLLENGVETGVHYPIPLHQQKAFENYTNRVSLAVTEKIAPRILSLPMDPLMSEKEVQFVCHQLKDLKG